MALPSISRMSVLFAGLFLTTEGKARVNKEIRPAFANVHLDHVTLAFRPSTETWLSLPIGQRFDVALRCVVRDEKGQALAGVSWVPSKSASKAAAGHDGGHGDAELPCRNAHPHVTVSTASGVEPVYSNSLLLRAAQAFPQALCNSSDAGADAKTGVEVERDGMTLRRFEKPVVAEAVVGVCFVDAAGHRHVCLNRDEVVPALAGSEQPLAPVAAPQQKRKLAVFDFDNTLVLVPGKQEGSRYYWQVGRAHKVPFEPFASFVSQAFMYSHKHACTHFLTHFTHTSHTHTLAANTP